MTKATTAPPRLKTPDEFPPELLKAWLYVIDNNKKLIIPCESYGFAVHTRQQLYAVRAAVRRVADGEIVLERGQTIFPGQSASRQSYNALWEKLQRAMIPKLQRGETQLLILPRNQNIIDRVGAALANAMEEKEKQPESPPGRFNPAHIAREKEPTATVIGTLFGDDTE